MNRFIDINDKKKIKELLYTLDPDQIPLWGKMTPQQMVEHLVENVGCTNGNVIFLADVSPEVALKAKEKWIYTDMEISHNVGFAVIPAEYRYPDLQAAVDQLINELADFDVYFSQPGATSDHAGYGALNHQEWLIWHGKHFTHHLKQFGLLPA